MVVVDESIDHVHVGSIGTRMKGYGCLYLEKPLMKFTFHSILVIKAMNG